jgi:hypothetical protein
MSRSVLKSYKSRFSKKAKKKKNVLVTAISSVTESGPLLVGLADRFRAATRNAQSRERSTG